MHQVQKPGALRCALAFPDVYEVGMSHLGLRILYDIINKTPFASAERAFAPWPDKEEHLKRTGDPLCSLETDTPLKNFDVVGFSLQYELCYTTVLAMLHLGGIPLRSEERLQSSKEFPLIIAGGPCAVNPAPMSAFIDAFLIGDGEEAILEMLSAVREWKAGGNREKESLLRELANIEGVYVPSLHPVDTSVRRRYVKDLNCALYPRAPILPYTSIVHDRVTIEVSRGCTMGCRFCQAGMIYRPLRERTPETILSIAEASLKNTGYDEVSFTSLSAGDYSHLLPLVREFRSRYGKSKIAISLPSLRVASIDREVLKEIRSTRKTGFTMAPEAATDRLRNVINKDFSDEDYERSLRFLFEEGWLTLKLYFMIGLPTEADADIEAIKEMTMRALRIAKQNTNKFVNIGVTVSPFVPKPHTPFQWYGQNSLSEIRRKLQYVREALNSKKLKYKGHDERMSFLEAVFSRGDERLSLLLEKAWESGCRLDGWSEHFDFAKWQAAMDATGIDGASYSERHFEKDSSLPWEMISSGIKKDFLYREYERALESTKTEDCKKICTACGLKCAQMKIRAKEEKIEEKDLCSPDLKPAASGPAGVRPKVRIRAQFSKTGPLRYLSHLELGTALVRALRRAEVPFDFSQGFHPTPRISFGPPLNVGVAGEREYFDLEVFTPFHIESYLQRINATLPEGLQITRMSFIGQSEPSLTKFITRYEYMLPLKEVSASAADEALSGIIPKHPFVVQREGQEVDIRPCIEDIQLFRNHDELFVRLLLRDDATIKVRIGEVVKALFGMSMHDLTITRTALYGWKGEWSEPL